MILQTNTLLFSAISGLILLCLPSLAQAELLQTQDGLSLRLLPDGRVERVEILGQRLGLNSFTSGLQVQDANYPNVAQEQEVQQVLKDPPVYRIAIPSLFLKGMLRYVATTNFIGIEVEIEDESGRERALDVSYSLPLGEPGWTWWEGLRAARKIENGQDYALFSVPSDAGSSGFLSAYPFTALSAPEGSIGLSMAVPATHPSCVEFRYVNGSMVAVFYLGTSPDCRRFPRKASAQMLLYRHNPAWGMRDAAQRYASFFPKYFENRSPQKGGMLFGLTAGEIDSEANEKALGARPSSLHGYHTSALPLSMEIQRQHQDLKIESFWELSPVAELRYFFVYPDSPAHAEDLLTKLGDPVFQAEVQPYWGARPDISKVVKISWARTAAGWPVLLGFQQDLPDKRAITQRELAFLLNVDPDLLEDWSEEASFTAGHRLLGALHATFESHPLLAGVCLRDVARASQPLNLNRGHFRYADLSLTYEKESRRPAILSQFSLVEFLNELRRRFQSADGSLRGKHVWVHGSQVEQSPLSALLLRADLASFEVRPESSKDSFASYDLLRALSMSKRTMACVGSEGAKAVLSGGQSEELIPAWLHRHTFYGIPLSFGKLWLAAEFQPLLARWGAEIRQHLSLQGEIQAAGWEAVTEARCSDPEVWVERYGNWRNGSIYFTLLNTREEKAEAVIDVDAGRLGLPAGPDLKIRELTGGSGSELRKEFKSGRVVLEASVGPGRCLLVEFKK